MRLKYQRKDQSTYNSFHGHEIISARNWENFAVGNFDLLQEYFPEFDLPMMYAVTWFIEHHLPFTIKKKDKVQMLVDTASQYDNVFTHCLYSDCEGRMSDGHDEKLYDTMIWCSDFIIKEPTPEVKITEDDKILYMLIGVCGSGKSTFKKSVMSSCSDEIINFSLDDLREEYYIDKSEHKTIEGYRKAFQASCDDKEFTNRMFKDYIEALKTGKNIIADNMNVTKKRRRAFLVEARKKGYKVIAVTFPNTLSTLLERQQTRTDKRVPSDVVINTYGMLQQPSLLEFDEIRIMRTF